MVHSTSCRGRGSSTKWLSTTVMQATSRILSVVLGPNYDGVSSFAPGGASRIPDGTDTDTTGDWVRNDFDLFGIPGFSGSPQLGEAENTPGAVNVADHGH